MPVDFHTIRSDHGGPRLGFEELVCQIARREPVPDGSEFRRVEGSGGDGGVEAYWLLPDGKKIGYQAKYFLRTGDINWSQVDKSVKQALASHPELTEYHVAFACDLTDRSGQKGRGKTGFEHWETHKATWEGWAAADDIPVSFTHVTSSTLVNRLTSPDSAGILAYWFNKPAFDHAWFRRRHEAIVADLNERYHPEDHVDVDVARCLDAVSRSSRHFENLDHEFKALVMSERLERLWHETNDPRLKEPMTRYRGLSNHLERARLKLKELSSAPIWRPLDLDPFIAVTTATNDDIELIIRSVDKIRKSANTDAEADKKIPFLCDRIIAECETLKVRVERATGFAKASSVSNAERERGVLIHGDPGIGKSHLLANFVSEYIDDGGPAVMLLGQHVGHSIQDTVLGRLDLRNFSFESILQMLDCAAEARRRRGLIVIDALNEADDLKVWRAELSGFLDQVLAYPNLSVVLSCRPEYLEAIIPENADARLVKVQHPGFASLEEQERAALVYLDKRGIARPATPWLNPEFKNPLFLRTCSFAMVQSETKVFPRGLRGSTHIMQFYLDRLEERLGARFPEVDLSPGFLRTLIASAINHLLPSLEKDCFDKPDLEAAIAEALGTDRTTEGQSWLSVLCSEGLFRKDHAFDADNRGTWVAPREQYRFAYQRFFDLFTVEQYLETLDDPKEVFAPERPLGELIKGEEWYEHSARFFGALAICIPEKFDGVELQDALAEHHSNLLTTYLLEKAFTDSLRWRDVNAFSDRTFELFDELANQVGDPRVELLIELSVVPGHPLNARTLDESLVDLDMPQRDRFWSVPVALAADDEGLGQAISTLIDWCLVADLTKADDDILDLGAVVTSWLFTTSARPVRDRATRALTRIISARPSVATSLVRHFARIDDLYLLERVLAAIYASCCRNLPKPAHADVCTVLWEKLFSKGSPPPHLLLRDYAVGVLELAELRGSLPGNIDLAQCKPPYKSSWPIETVTKAEVEAIADAAGDKSILFSAGGWGDFARYTIEPRILDFTSLPLSEEQPLTQEERMRSFREVLTTWTPGKKEAFENLEQAITENRKEELTTSIETLQAPRSGKKQEHEGSAAEFPKAELDAFEALLDKSELQVFERDALPNLLSDRAEKIPKFDPDTAKNWVAKRAYEYGWTKDLFDREPNDYNSRQRPRYERVGKKYQWLALEELLARLADNVWMPPRYGDPAKNYARACDVNFIRDIDPTVPVIETQPVPEGGTWWRPYTVSYEEASDTDVARWPFEPVDLPDPVGLIEIEDATGRVWLTLKAISSFDERYEDNIRSDMPFRRSCFARLSALIVRRSDLCRVVGKLTDKVMTDPTDWEYLDVVDSGFYREFPWRPPWTNLWNDFSVDEVNAINDVEIIRPAVEYRWESHLDAGLPGGALCAAPSPWLANVLSLKPSTGTFGAFVDSDGDLVFQDAAAEFDSSPAALVNKDDFLKAIRKRNLECVWVVAGEKDCCPTGTRKAFGERRFTYLVTVNNGRLSVVRSATTDFRRGLRVYDQTLNDVSAEN